MAETETADFNPADHTAAEVVEHLKGSQSAEVFRVLELEKGASKPRSSVLSAAEGLIPEPDEDGYTRVIVSS